MTGGLATAFLPWCCRGLFDEFNEALPMACHYHIVGTNNIASLNSYYTAFDQGCKSVDSFEPYRLRHLYGAFQV